MTSLVQLKILFSRHIEDKSNSPEELERLLKLLLGGNYTLFEKPCYATVVSKSVIKDVIYTYICILSEETLSKFQETDRAIRCVNKIVLRVVNNTNKNNVLG